jgi:hypothetical protein
MFLAISGFPIVTAQLAFYDNLLTLLSQRSEALAGFTPHGYVYESSDLLAFTFASLKNSLFAIVADATGVRELVSLKVGFATSYH